MPLSDSLPCRGPQPRILIVRLSAVVDLVMATSLLEALRERWPQAYIAWIVNYRAAGLLDGDRRLDALIRIPKEVFRRPGTAFYLRRELRGHEFDWVIDAQDDGNSRLIARLVPKAARIGFDASETTRFMFSHRVPRQRDARLIASDYRKLAEQLTGEPGPPPLLPVDEATRSAVRSQMRDLGLEPGFIALCPFSQRADKSWPAEHWVRLAALIEAQGLGRCAIIGAPAHESRADALMPDMPSSALSLVGRVRLLNVPAWMWHARAVVGLDNSMTHVAVAVRRPVVALFGARRPYGGGTESPFAVLPLGARTGEPAQPAPDPDAVLAELRRTLQIE